MGEAVLEEATIFRLDDSDEEFAYNGTSLFLSRKPFLGAFLEHTVLMCV